MMKRSKTDRIIGGVCGGIGKYFDINPWAPRLVFLLAGGFWIYVILLKIIRQIKNMGTSSSTSISSSMMAASIL